MERKRHKQGQISKLMNPQNSDTATREVLDRLNQLPLAYTRTMQEAQLKGMSRWRDCHDNYLAATKATYEESLRQAGEAQKAFSSSAREAASKPDAARELEEAYRSYMEKVSRAQEEIYKRYAEAAQAYATSVADLQQEAQKQAINAYRDYLQGIKEAWTTVDVNAVLEAALGSSSNE
jgi:hypothetical protein